jgi:hypothetical protein
VYGVAVGVVFVDGFGVGRGLSVGRGLRGCHGLVGFRR